MTNATEQPRRGKRPAKKKPSQRAFRTHGEVQSVKRALTILNTLAEHGVGLTLKDLAFAVDLPTSTVHRLLTTLQSEHYTYFEKQGGLWLIGFQANIVANSVDDRIRRGLADGLQEKAVARSNGVDGDAN